MAWTYVSTGCKGYAINPSLILIYSLYFGQVDINFGQVENEAQLVLGQVRKNSISTPLLNALLMYPESYFLCLLYYVTHETVKQ